MATTVSHAGNLEMNPKFVSGQSATIQSLNAIVSEVAGTNIPVLLVGESGTGKEVYARLIHRLSRNCRRPLTKLSCRGLEPGEFLARLRTCLSAEAQDLADGLHTLFLDGID